MAPANSFLHVHFPRAIVEGFHFTSMVFIDDFPKRHIHEGGKYCFYYCRFESTEWIDTSFLFIFLVDDTNDHKPATHRMQCRVRRPHFVIAVSAGALCVSAKCSTVQKSNKFSSLHRLQLKCCRFTAKIQFCIYENKNIASFRSLSLQSPPPHSLLLCRTGKCLFYFIVRIFRCCCRALLSPP